MSEKQMKKFRREFRARHGRTKALGYEPLFRNCLKTVTLTEERKAERNAVLAEKRKSKKERRPWDVVLQGLPKAGQQYIKKTARIVSDEVRMQYQQDKRLFRHGANR